MTSAKSMKKAATRVLRQATAKRSTENRGAVLAFVIVLVSFRRLRGTSLDMILDGSYRPQTASGD